MNAFTLRPFVIYFLTNTLSLLGTWIQKVGLGWLTWQITESTFWTSFVSIALMAPVGIIGPFIAVYAESWDMRRAFLITKILMMLVSFVIFGLQYFDMHNLHSLIATSLALGLLSAVHHPIRLVFISIVVPRPYLASAIGLNSVSWNMSRVVGPGLSGFAIVLLGLATTFGIAVILYAPLIVALALLPLEPRAKAKPNADRFFQKMRDGGKVALQTPLIFTALCMVALNSFLVRGVLEIQPAIIGQILGGESQALATATAAAGVGALLASGWIGLGKLPPDFIQRCLWPMLAIGIVGTACLNLTSTIIPMSLIFVLTGFTATVAGIGAQTLIQLKVEEDYRARVMTWWSSVSFGSLTIGGILIGFFGDLTPIEDAIFMVMVPGFLLAILVLVKLPLARWKG
ncbi:MFS transporter [Alphaproteobacteria bacterium]|jgi:MFS family permease|nr:MFS transporter [Alphaproteobacteria bacterium]MDC1191365.1 MFS transporter [Candidatus Puniceispirillum sp.]MDA9054496.1 MFS transporter [Alphaproteobacteria bacterium]MDA9132824.1 MFS transporter [Alphaproteobacteria bacterium]MDB0013581.1 MFS transporter [Alphaproteobacteria bacterium]